MVSGFRFQVSGFKFQVVGLTVLSGSLLRRRFLIRGMTTRRCEENSFYEAFVYFISILYKVSGFLIEIDIFKYS